MKYKNKRYSNSRLGEIQLEPKGIGGWGLVPLRLSTHRASDSKSHYYLLLLTIRSKF